MRRQTAVALIISAMAIAAGGCGSSVTTIPARHQATELEAAPSPNLARAISLYQSGDYVKAESTLILTVKSDSANWQAHQLLGLVRLGLGRYRQAGENLLQSLDRAPNDNRVRAGLYAALGECWENLKESGKARLHYHTALNLWPQCTSAREGLARLGSVSDVDGP